VSRDVQTVCCFPLDWLFAWSYSVSLESSFQKFTVSFGRLTYEKGEGANAKAKHNIRSPPVDDVNNLWHHHKCQRALASTVIQIRRNALFTSPEYAILGLSPEPCA